MTENTELSFLIKEMPFPFLSLTCHNNIVVYLLEYFMSQSALKFCVLPGQQDLVNMVARVNLLSMRVKGKGSECISII